MQKLNRFLTWQNLLLRETWNHIVAKFLILLNDMQFHLSEVGFKTSPYSLYFSVNSSIMLEFFPLKMMLRPKNEYSLPVD